MSVIDAKEMISSDDAVIASSGATTCCEDPIDGWRGASVAQQNAWGSSISNYLAGGGKMFLNLVVKTTFTGAGATLIPKVATKAADASLHSAGTVLVTGPTIPALTAAGYKISIPIPPGSAFLRYYGAIYTVSGGNLGAGAVDAWFSDQPVSRID